MLRVKLRAVQTAVAAWCVGSILAQSPQVDSFDPEPDYRVYCLLPQPDGKILAGGIFGHIGGANRGFLARLNNNGSPELSFFPNPSSSVFCGAIQSDGKLVVGGLFSNLGGYSRNGIGGLTSDGTMDTNFDARSDGRIDTIALQPDGKLLVVGGFLNLSGQAVRSLARLLPGGGLDTNFVAAPSGPVYGIAAEPDGGALAAGAFSLLNGQVRNTVSQLNGNGTLDTNYLGATWDIGTDVFYSPRASCLVRQPDGKLLVGGAFTNFCGKTRTSLGRLNADGSLDEAFNPTLLRADQFPATVFCLALQTDGKILVGGSFASLCGQARTNLGRLNPDGTLDPSFDAQATGVASAPEEPFVLCVTIQPDGKILVGGDFARLAGQARRYLGRLENTEAAVQNLSYDGTNITWLRGGTSPEVWRTSFESTTNGTDWMNLGAGTRIPGGWQLKGASLPIGSSLRARGYVTTGQNNGSAWFCESALGAPFIEVQPKDRTNYESTVAVFSVFAAGTEELKWQWKRNQIDLVGQTNSTLTLSNIQPIESGDYTVTVSNDLGTRMSAVAHLTVWARPAPLIGNSDFGFHGGQFGFDVHGPPGQTVAIDASYTLPFWIATGTNLVLGTNSSHFSDPYSERVPHRFYRVRAVAP